MNLLLNYILLSIVSGKIIFHDDFSDENFMDSWKMSKSKDYGSFELAYPQYYPKQDSLNDVPINKGIKTAKESSYYALSKKLQEPFTNKDKDLYISFEVTFVENVDCAGGYIKLLPDMDPIKFNGETPYNIMFGPDVCGSDKKVHVILNHKNTNHQIKHTISVPYEEITHQYVLALKKDKTIEVYVDSEKKENGTITSLFENIMPSEFIEDANDKKPEDWEESEYIDDTNDKKPEDWDVAPQKINDPNAKKPENWDDDADGEWEAPQIANPEYKGEWKPKQIKNPNYKGIWKPKQIPNPEYNKDEVIAEYEFNHVGFDLWQVKPGTVFQNIVIATEESDIKPFMDNFKVIQENIKKTKEEEQNKKVDANKENSDKKNMDSDDKEEEEEDSIEETEDSNDKKDEL